MASPRVAIIDYGSGNLRSAAKAFEAVGAAATVSADPATLKAASHIVLPGVGAFGDCIRGLTSIPGMADALEEQVRARKKPFLGICVGMQMLLERGHEHGTHAGLGWIPGDAVRLTPAEPALKVPHMGWNELNFSVSHPLYAGLRAGDHAYFVHSYHARCAEEAHILATTDYGGAVAAVIGRDNILGVQFHPEKSQHVGLRLLENFLCL
ncbi:MAG: imidazole glycerol phosphate synthase subunit HisH [Alphaproteobacteria bacterium]|nr:imidazole glycerol phosphate synthase subunit HisH [Alphaproteobacteria bacterium]